MADQKPTLIDNKEEFLRHLKSRTHVYHLSNIFFRDFQYGIISFAATKGRKMSYAVAENMATTVIRDLEQSGILKPLKNCSWMLNYPEFKTVLLNPQPASKPETASAPKSVPQATPLASASPTPAPVADAPPAA